MDLDLGNSVVYNVKVNGNAYKLSAPTVVQARKFQDKVKQESGSEIDVFISLVVALGMPKDVAEKLDLGQLRKLSEGIMGVNEKK